MQVTTVSELRALLGEHRRAGDTVGFVPTMGYLHDGHASLMREAARSSDLVVVSVFVNPLQFGAAEDLDSYPRDLERDSELARESGVDVLFVPSLEEMYPRPVATTVAVDELSNVLDGAARPGHFAGVATVVAKLFNIVGPCNAYFGLKDFQQLAVIHRMVTDLSMPVTVVGCPTVRDRDGLALSSRNSYLTRDERAAAPVIHRALQAGAAALMAGEDDIDVVQKLMADIVNAEPLARLDYVTVVDADSLSVPERPAGNLRLLAAVGLGRARLIDNVGVTL